MMIESKQPTTLAQTSKGLNIALWIVQGLLALTFAGTAVWKWSLPSQS